MRQSVGPIIALIVILLVGVVGYRALFSSTGPELRVLRVVGRVERRAAQLGPTALVAGDLLDLQDSVQVGDDGELSVAVGEEAELRLRSGTTVTITEVGERGLRLELEQGRVTARVRRGGAGVGVGAGPRAARLTEGEANIGRDASDLFTVEAVEGEVAVDGAPGHGALGPGEALVVSGEGGVVEAHLAEALLLELLLPEARDEQGRVSIIAHTSPFSMVRVRGEGAPLAEDGGPLTLRANGEGELRLPPMVVPPKGLDLVLDATDPFGRTVSQRQRVEPPPGPELSGSEVRWAP